MPRLYAKINKGMKISVWKKIITHLREKIRSLVKVTSCLRRKENNFHKKSMMFLGSAKNVSSLLFLMIDKNGWFHCVLQ